MPNATKKAYAAPRVEVLGSMRELTRGNVGVGKDGGQGGKSKDTGAA